MGVWRVSGGCLEGVWEVSGRCLAHSRLCLEHINAKSIAISPVGIINLVYFIFFQWPILAFGCVVPCNTAEFRCRTFPTCYDDSENCSEQPKTNEMGIHRAPIKFLTFVFLAPPNIAFLLQAGVMSMLQTEGRCWFKQESAP